MTGSTMDLQRFTTRHIHPTFGLEISGLDVTAPMDAETISTITKLSSEYKLLIFKDQSLSTDKLNLFAQYFGDTKQEPPKTSVTPTRADNISELGTRGEEAGPISGYDIVARFWHTDSSWRAVPTWLSFLTAVVIPDSGSGTAYCDMEAAYNALSDERKALLEGKQMVHAFTAMRHFEPTIPAMSQEDAPPPAVHPVVRTVDGRKSLFLSNQTSYYVGNMLFEEGRALYDELFAHATSPQFVYEHQWQPGDLAMWDNRATMHRAMPYDRRKKRLMHRAEVKGTQIPA